MRVLLDTNIFCQDYSLKGPTLTTLLSGLQVANHLLFVPEMVIDEVVNKFCEEYTRLVNLTRKLGLASAGILPTPYNLTDPNQMKEEYRSFLQNTLESANAKILGYPTTSHRELVSRALERKKPFRSTDTGGYRDALIWESLVHLASDGEKLPIAFITANTKDFALQGIGLHPDLISDLQDRGKEYSEIRLWFSLEDFNKEHVQPAFQFLEDVRSKLVSGTYDPLNLATFVEEKLGDMIGWMELEPLDIGFPPEFESPSIVFFDSVNSINNVEVRKMPSGDLLISFSIEVLCEFIVLIHKGAYYSLGEEDRPFVWDNDWNSHYMAGTASTDVEIEFGITFSVEKGEVSAAEVRKISPKYGWWERERSRG